MAGRAFAILLLIWTAAGAQEADDPVQRAVAQLKSEDARERTRAAKTLGRLGGDEAKTALRQALRDGAEVVRLMAAVSLVRLEERDAALVDLLAGLLRSEDWYTRWQACLGLGAMRVDARPAIPALVNAALDPQADVTQEAIHALAKIAPRDQAVQDAYVRLLTSKMKVDRAFLLKEIRIAKNLPSIEPWLAEEFHTNANRLRDRAYKVLLERKKFALVLFTESLVHKDPEVRALCARGLGELVAHDGAEPLAKALGDKEPEVREAAATALGRLKAKGAVFSLIEVLHDDDRRVRLAAIAALARIGKPAKAAAPALVRLFAKPYGEIEEPVRMAMKAVGFPALVEFLGTTRERDRWYVGFTVVVGAAGVPGRPRDPKTVDHLMAELEQNPHGANVVTALRDVLPEGADAQLVEMLRSEYAQERRAGACLLGHFAEDKERARKALRKAALDSFKPAAVAAADALDRLDGKVKAKKAKEKE